MTTPTPPRISRFSSVYIGLGTALAILVIVVVQGVLATSGLGEAVRLQARTHEVQLTVHRAAEQVRAAESAHRGYVSVGDAHFVDEYNKARDSLFTTLAHVRRMTADNARQQEQLDDTEAAARTRFAYLDSTNALRAMDSVDAALRAIDVGSLSAERAAMYTRLLEIENEEARLLGGRSQRVQHGIQRSKWINLAGLAASAILVVMSIRMFRGEAARRRHAKQRLKSSEERLLDFLDSASDLIQSSDAEGRLVFVNRSLLQTLGYTADEVIGKSSDMFFAPECVEEGRALFKRLLAGEHVTDISTVYIRKDGRRINVAGNSNIRFENGKAVASRTILRDVTRQNEVDQMKDEFVSIVSHELRTPLTSIRGALGLLANGMLGDVEPRARRMLDVAISNTDRLVRLINDILDVERIESGSVPMSRHKIQLKEVTHHVDGLMRPLAEKAGVKLVIETDDVALSGDEDRIVQMLTNLLSNAIKFSPRDTVVSMRAVRENRDVHITVSDEGRGIPGDMLETVFERFQQVDASDAREKGGSGLGLAISRGIVEQHEGRIWVESVLGSGAVFHVLLPVLDEVAKPAPLTHEQLAAGAEGPLVLICDDDADVRTVLAEMLADRGYRVITAESGGTALGLAAQHRPAVILLDLMMPGDYDGWRTMAALKENTVTSDIPVLILSGSDEEWRKGLPTHANETRMQKPVDAGSLVREIERALRQWGSGANVLVVEDDEDLARILIEFLRTHGLTAAHAIDGREAVRMSQQLQPALIILDLMLPDTDGFAVVDWLRQHDRLSEVPIMVYTARDLDEQQRARLGLAPELLFTKSRMAPEELVDRVAAMVGRMTWDNENAES